MAVVPRPPDPSMEGYDEYEVQLIEYDTTLDEQDLGGDLDVNENIEVEVPFVGGLDTGEFAELVAIHLMTHEVGVTAIGGADDNAQGTIVNQIALTTTHDLGDASNNISRTPTQDDGTEMSNSTIEITNLDGANPTLLEHQVRTKPDFEDSSVPDVAYGESYNQQWGVGVLNFRKDLNMRHGPVFSPQHDTVVARNDWKLNDVDTGSCKVRNEALIACYWNVYEGESTSGFQDAGTVQL